MNQLYWRTDEKFIARWMDDNRSDKCEHVEAGIPAYAVGCEDDSFGPLCRNLFCKPCYDKAIEEEGNEEVVCDDCKKRLPRKETFEWKWYDFYAAQGDEPLIICFPCRELFAHKERVRRDWEERQAEEEGVH